MVAVNLPPVLHPFLAYTGQGGGNLYALALMVRFANDWPDTVFPPGHIERLCRLAVCHDFEPLHFVCTPFPSWVNDPRAWSCEVSS